MLSFARRRPPPAVASIPPGCVVYAVGDIHGRLDLLNKLLAWITADFSAIGSGVRGCVVFLGDYLDRGPESCGVLEQLSAPDLPAGLTPILLRGNHEQMLLDVLEDPSKAPTWVRFGGGATMTSYGVTPPSADASPEQWQERIAALETAMPLEHKQLLHALEYSVQIGDFFFVHAGVNPDRPLEGQLETDLLWIRERFLKHKRSFGKMIVHGHSTAAEPMVSDNRIGIDTGAYATGILTCLRIHGQEWKLIGVRLAGCGLWSE